MTYAETAQAAFQYGPPNVRKFANFVNILVNSALCATYIGGVCVYVVFIGESIKQVRFSFESLTMKTLSITIIENMIDSVA